MRILVWNIFWGLGAPTSATHQAFYGTLYFVAQRKKDVGRKIAKYVKQVRPDIVALQEADGSKNSNHAKMIGAAANMPYTHFSVERKGKDWSNGNALVSRYKFTKVIDDKLPYHIEKRNYILAEIIVGRKKITIINTHLAAHDWNTGERLKQVKALCVIIKKRKTPVILLGDLNCGPGFEEFKYLVEHSGLRPLVKQPTYPIYEPKMLYDNVLVSKGFKVKNVELLEVELSDHLPIYVELA
jgi:endonuclease/exonuclease/phosphatase family metal-dependent hydrolase